MTNHQTSHQTHQLIDHPTPWVWPHHHPILIPLKISWTNMKATLKILKTTKISLIHHPILIPSKFSWKKDESNIENTRNNQDQSDPDDEPFRQQDSTPSSRSNSTQCSQRKNVKKNFARPKRKVRRPHLPHHKMVHKKGKQQARIDFSPSRPSSIPPNQPDHTPDTSPHRITHYNKGKQPQRNNRSPSRSSSITPNETGHSPGTSPHRTTRFNKGKKPARTNPSASQSRSYIAPHPSGSGMSRPGRQDAPDNHRHTNDRESILSFWLMSSGVDHIFDIEDSLKEQSTPDLQQIGTPTLLTPTLQGCLLQ